MEKKFVIVCEGRCGSTLLLSSLSQHPQLKKIEHEVLRWDKLKYIGFIAELPNLIDKYAPLPEDLRESGKSNLESLQNIYNNFYISGDTNKILRHNVNHLVDEVFKQINGFKIPYYQYPTTHSIWDHIQKYKIIHLIRKNRFEAFISEKIARNTNVYQLDKDKEPISDTPFSVKTIDFICYCDYMEDKINYFLNKLQNSLIIYYEDLCNNWRDCIFEIEKFLEIREIELPMLYRKRIATPLNVLVTNYNEIKDTLRRYTNYLTAS